MESDAASAESRKRKREEYEMQLFGFHSRAVFATLENIVLDRIRSKNRKLCETLRNIHKPDQNKLAVLSANEKELYRAYYNASSTQLEHLESIVNKFIAVPDNVLSEEDAPQRTQWSKLEVEDVLKMLEEMRRRAKSVHILNAVLKEELQLVDQFSICADNIDRLNQIIESEIACPDVGDKIHRLVDDYKQFSALERAAGDAEAAPVSQKSRYYTIDDVKCIDYDVDTL
ncbi:PREDICTED: uncharacterized protein LOC105559794 isoform X2 [Vollenhovia emeryi]|uniref:uncharacterized protein LOC105559794 isoform X2 n=1 Tax=Vollenhovia emeryi TaxID=411798 RepID=UPI0005F3B130|nr:PREDICTED: uncharacterized protein LOC105559794 isoform X2 [Vollenhovia emeryi]